MTTPDPEQNARAVLAAEAVNSLDWDDVYTKARLRMKRDATGTFYDQHLAREIADRLAAALTTPTPRQEEAVAVPAGMKLVPREPTDEMIEAGDDCYGVARGTESWVIGGCKGSEKIWSAMLAATPDTAPLSGEDAPDFALTHPEVYDMASGEDAPATTANYPEVAPPVIAPGGELSVADRLFEVRCFLKSITNSDNEERWHAGVALEHLDAASRALAQPRQTDETVERLRDDLAEKAEQCERLSEVSRTPACFEYRAKAVAYREARIMLAALATPADDGEQRG